MKKSNLNIEWLTSSNIHRFASTNAPSQSLLVMLWFLCKMLVKGEDIFLINSYMNGYNASKNPLKSSSRTGKIIGFSSLVPWTPRRSSIPVGRENMASNTVPGTSKPFLGTWKMVSPTCGFHEDNTYNSYLKSEQTHLENNGTDVETSIASREHKRRLSSNSRALRVNSSVTSIWFWTLSNPCTVIRHRCHLLYQVCSVKKAS